DLADAMRQRTIPVDLVDHRPPEEAQHRHAFFAQALGVFDARFKPDFAVDRLTFDAGLGEHQRDAIALPVIARDFVQPRWRIRAALPYAARRLIQLPVAVRVVIEPEHIRRL